MASEPDPIVKAVQYAGADYLVLTLQPAEGDEYTYVLSPDDPYGWAPVLREELARMVDAGEIVIDVSPDPPPGPLPPEAPKQQPTEPS